MRRGRAMGALSAAVFALVLPAAAQADVKAGAAAVDATWHVGASAGQYASDGAFVGVHGVDPHTHQTRRAASYGVQSRLQVRALVVEGPDGTRIAVVKNDLYIPQDLLYRRTAQLLEAGDSGITRETLTMAVTHNHSSPYYSSTAWGAWAFQDVFDVRFYDYYARRMAEAVEKAADQLVPVRVGASVSQFDKTHRHSFGPAVADDGTPAGYPHGEVDHDLAVVRFDDISDPANPKPLANLVSYSLHPEFLEGNDLISADYVGPLQRMTDRQTGALTIFTQNAVGTAEPERSSFHDVHERLEFTHREYAQAEYGARLMSDSIVGTWREIAEGDPPIPFDDDFEVAMEDRWFPGPLSHPYPGVSNCRTDKAFAGDPQLPVVGLPDCESTPLADIAPPPSDILGDTFPGISTDTLQEAGIPVPENYSAPSYTGLEEDVSVHLQAFRLGGILFTVCSCEQWTDQSRNIKTRTNAEQGDMWLGYDWGERCTQRPDGDWDCPDPRNPANALPPVTDHEYRRMRAQVLNDAAGWDAPENALFAESEPVDPEQIKGNFTHEELPPEQAYDLTVTISMANDYNGYIASYREYQRGDHYRKALTGWGPHSSDYMATRLVRMGGHLNGGPDLEREPLQEKVELDLVKNDLAATALGTLGNTSIRAYEALLPDDGGPVVAVREPEDIERFAAAFFTWNGGSNFTDNPEVRVQRQVDGEWEDYADGSGEVPVTLKFPQADEMPAYLSGAQRWEWTAHFEAFAANFDPGGGRATPEGTYRFAVRGLHRQGGQAVPYTIESRPFEVRPWGGITVEDLRVDPSGRASFHVGPRSVREWAQDGPPVTAQIGPIDYPDTYDSPTRFVRLTRFARRDPQAPEDPTRLEWYCFTCSFRPWADTGDAATVMFTIGSEQVPGILEDGRWRSARPLEPGETAFVAAGGVQDFFGNVNGQASQEVTRP
jgi:hypothetical protein